MLEPLGQSQVITYQERLAEKFTIWLISFEKKQGLSDKINRQKTSRRLRIAGIKWIPIRYHKFPSLLATTWDMLLALGCSLVLIKRYDIKIIHARSYVPAVVALVLKKIIGIRFVFDMRGFWADERVDGNLWPADGALFRIAKLFEKSLLLNADYIIVLTNSAFHQIKFSPIFEGRLPNITIIPTCADLNRFVSIKKTSEKFSLGYVGSASTWYEFDAVIECFHQLKRIRPDSQFIIVNRNEHRYIRDRLAKGRIPENETELLSLNYEEVPQVMSRFHAGVFFYKQTFSRKATAPTKLAEFLGCGIPCLSNRGVGDLEEILEGERVGIVIQDFSAQSIKDGIERLIKLIEEDGISARCRKVAENYFSLHEGVKRYEQVYDQLIKR